MAKIICVLYDDPVDGYSSTGCPIRNEYLIVDGGKLAARG